MTMTPEEKREIIEVVTSLIGPTGDYMDGTRTPMVTVSIVPPSMSRHHDPA